MPKSKRVTESLVDQEIAVLKAHPDFAKLKKLVPTKLKGKEMGKDIESITTDREMYERRGKDDKIIFFTESEWGQYEKFSALCDELAERHGLHWATVESLAMGISNPTVPFRLAKSIKAYLCPTVFAPPDFDINCRYVSHVKYATPMEVIEIMERLRELDEHTKAEIKRYLKLLIQNKTDYRTVEIEKAEDSEKTSHEEVNIDVCMRIPIGYSTKEVAEAYARVDRRRKQILTALGMPFPKRRRSSTLLKDAERLRLFKEKVDLHRIVDAKYPEHVMEEDRHYVKAVKKQRYKGQQLIEKKYGKSRTKPMKRSGK
jgi:hypothetical protein